jgi:tRNA-splicing endonuclease subunit Sen2
MKCAGPSSTCSRLTSSVMTTVSAAAPRPQPAQQPKPRAFVRPNYGKLHARALPLAIYPLPPLIPQNPLSVLQITFTYIYHILFPPSSHPECLYKAHWSPESHSVHVTDHTAMRALWECGFFGKGSLSRSEPSWLDREKRRRGLLASETSEEFTIQRREERKKFKNERARLQREAIEEKLKEENRQRASDGPPESTARARYDGLNGGSVDNLTESIESLIVQEPLDPRGPALIPLAESTAVPPVLLEQLTERPQCRTREEPDVEASTIVNEEHLQLTPSEAFFLVYGLGILSIHEQDAAASLTSSGIFTSFRQYSYFPPLPSSSLSPDDPFLLLYTAYHHFRSLGWVVRPGIKFAVDWLLYLRGPVFSHAEFAVIVLPAYTHPYWRSTPELDKSTRRKESKSWWWLHCVNRVQSQVKKSLVLVYVEIPPPSALPSVDIKGILDIGMFLKSYKVRELTLKRWIANRERD